MIVEQDLSGRRWTVEAQTPLEEQFVKALLRGLGYAYGPSTPLHPTTPPFEDGHGGTTQLTTADSLEITDLGRSSRG